MEVCVSRPGRPHFSSILQLVSSPRPCSADFESMEDIHDLTSLVASSTESISDAGHSISSSNTNHSFNTPLLCSPLNQSNTRTPLANLSTNSKRARSNLGRSIDYSAPQRTIPSPKLPTRSKSLGGNFTRPNMSNSRQKRLSAIDDEQTAPFSDVSHSPITQPPRSRAHHNKLRHSLRDGSNFRRTSLDLSPNMMQASIRRLKRTPSLWTVGDRSTPIGEARDRPIHNLRAEPQLSDQQKLVALRRARKIAQVFGSEVPADLMQASDHSHNLSAARRDSMSTIQSTDVPPSLRSTRQRSNSDSSTLFSERKQCSSTSLDQSRPPSVVVSIDAAETSPSLFPPSSFSERRRRAAKLTQFFGVNYQDISQSINQKLLPPSSRQETFSKANIPVADVDVKVAGRRFWGLADGEMKNADVADVIGKLRGLRAT